MDTGALHMSIKFGTDGWRAVVGKDFTPENVAHIIQAFADLYPHSPGRGRPVVVGYDRRNQSPEMAQLVTDVLTANGITTYLSSTFCPTPGVSWNVVKYEAAAGVVVTASHNPPDWNGIKFKESYGGAASPAYTDPIEAQIAKNQAAGKRPKTDGQRSLLQSFDPAGPYLQALREFVDLDRINRSGFKILYDPMYGAGAGLFGQLVAGVTEIRGDRDVTFNGIHPEPIVPYVNDTIAAMRGGTYALGVINDGDADRIGAVDETGRYVTTHEIYAVILLHLLRERQWRGQVVKSITTTRMIDRICTQYDGPLHVTPVGFKHISPALNAPNMLVGGEESGGIGIPRHLCERDGLLCGLLLCEMMAIHKKPIGQLVAALQQEFGPTAYRRVDLRLTPAQMQTARHRLAGTLPDTLCGQSVRHLDRIDGYHFLREDESWLLIRASGTEPLLRTYAEARTSAEVDALLQAAQEIIGL